jgi:hypothetical protein
MVSGDSIKAKRMGLVTNKADEFGEVDIGGASYATLRTCQAAPYGVVRRLFQFIKRTLNNLPG